MILINKKSEGNFPQAYQSWLSENQNAIASLHTDLRSARTLWELLGKTLTERETDIDPLYVRYQLQCSLYEEQGGICCYCGDRLRRDWNDNTQKWTFFHQSIEHFKGKSQYKSLMFNYENLMLCCKNSSGFSKVKVGDMLGGIEVRSWEDATGISGIPSEKIIDYRPNRHLKQKNRLENGDVIHIPNPAHCDDQKSRFDSTPDLVIINPTCDGHLIEKLTLTTVHFF